MAITTTYHNTIYLENTTGHQYFRVKYRLTGTSLWTQYNTSGTTISISGLAVNYIYDFQVTNVDNNTNPSSAIQQAINITDPEPIISPINTGVGYSFSNLSPDMTSYTITVAPGSDPGDIIESQTKSPTDTITGSFTGLIALTDYILSITPVAGPFYKTFTYLFTTTASATCPAPQSVNASFV